MVAHALAHAHSDTAGWLGSLEGKYPPAQLELLAKAADWLEAHADQLTADTGAPLVSHSLGAAAMLAGMQFDVEIVAAALVCSLPGPALAVDRLVPALGDPVSHLARGAARLHEMDRLLAEAQPEGPDQSEALRQMLLAMTDDIRV